MTEAPIVTTMAFLRAVEPVLKAAEVLSDKWRTPGQKTDSDDFFAAIHALDEAFLAYQSAVAGARVEQSHPAESEQVGGDVSALAVLRKVRDAFKVEYLNGQPAGVSYDNEALRPVISLMDAALAAGPKRTAGEAEPGHNRYRLIESSLREIVACDDDAKAAAGILGATLNGVGLVDLFDVVAHPFGAGEHKQQPYRSNHLDMALKTLAAPRLPILHP